MDKAVEDTSTALLPSGYRDPMGNKQSGFSLVEIVLVLAVVGLLLGGILKGGAMLHQAKVRKTAQMVEDIRTANNLFYRERGRLAGDGGVGGGGVAGTAVNGYIAGTTEIDAFKDELINNGYLKGGKEGTSAWIWRHALNGVIWVEATGTRNFIILTNITAEDRKFFDGQFDGDGNDSTGPVQFSTHLKIYL